MPCRLLASTSMPPFRKAFRLLLVKNLTFRVIVALFFTVALPFLNLQTDELIGEAVDLASDLPIGSFDALVLVRGQDFLSGRSNYTPKSFRKAFSLSSSLFAFCSASRVALWS
jgi:hypothetical protein